MVTVPLVLLAIPSGVIGWLTVKPVLFGDYFDGAIQVLPAHDVLGSVGEEFQRQPLPSSGMPSARCRVYLAGAGVLAAYVFFLKKPGLADAAERKSPQGCTRSSSTNTASTGSMST